MSYLLSQIWICLLLAALIGGIIGWLLRGGCKKKIEAVELDWRNRFAGVEQERNEMSSRLGDLDNISREHAEMSSKLGRLDKISREHEQLLKEVSSLRSIRDDQAAKLVALEANTAEVSSQLNDVSTKLDEAADDTQDSYDIEGIEGIGKGYGKRLRAMNIETTRDLLKASPNVSGIQSVAQDIQMENDVVRSWSSMADLMRVRGIGGQYAELLEYSGVHTVQSLADSDGSGLAIQLADVNAKENRVREVPDTTTVSSWIHHAKTLPQILDDDIISLKPGARTISDTVMIADMDIQAAIAGLEDDADDDNQSSYDIEEIEGIGKGYGKKLSGVGIATTTDLLEKCPDTTSMQPVIETMNLEDWVISSWVSMADLMRVRGIGGQYAELLNFSDIHTVQALANANAAGLAAKLKQVNDKEHRVKEVPESKTIAGWIDHAKTLPALLSLS